MRRNELPAWHAWGILEWRLGHIEAARAIFTKALEVNPKHHKLHQLFHVRAASFARWAAPLGFRISRGVQLCR